jgi:hypothetical protein
MYGGEGRGRTPIAVEPSLMASREYSTWKRRPSGEKVLCVCERAAWMEGRGVYELDTAVWETMLARIL